MYGKGSGSQKHSNLFVGNLSAEVTDESLKTAFSQYGGVDSTRVMSKEGKTSGFVKMSDTAGADRAIAALNGTSGLVVKYANFDIGGKREAMDQGSAWPAFGKGAWPAYAPDWGYGGWGKGGWGKGGDFWGGKGGWGKGGKDWWGGMGMGMGGYGMMPAYGMLPPQLPDRNKPEKPEGSPCDNLYIKHLPIGITDEELKKTFEKAGEVSEFRIIRPEFGLEWAALVRMASEAEATKARQTLDDTYPDCSAQPLLVKNQMKNGSAVIDHLYIKNVPLQCTKEKLQSLFEKYGEVKWAKVNPPAMGYKIQNTTGLVQLSSAEACNKAMAELNNKSLALSDIGATMKVRYAVNKESTKDKDKDKPDAA